MPVLAKKETNAYSLIRAAARKKNISERDLQERLVRSQVVRHEVFVHTNKCKRSFKSDIGGSIYTKIK